VRSERLADCQSAIQQFAKLRYLPCAAKGKPRRARGSVALDREPVNQDVKEQTRRFEMPVKTEINGWSSQRLESKLVCTDFARQGMPRRQRDAGFWNIYFNCSGNQNTAVCQGRARMDAKPEFLTRARKLK